MIWLVKREKDGVTEWYHGGAFGPACFHERRDLALSFYNLFRAELLVEHYSFAPDGWTFSAVPKDEAS